MKCLEAVKNFISWIPKEYIFEKDFLCILVENLFAKETSQQAAKLFRLLGKLNYENDEK